MLTTFDNIFFDSKLITVMAARTHTKLCEVEGGCYMNILFVSACVVPVTAAKLCRSCFLNFWQQRQASAVILPTVDLAI